MAKIELRGPGPHGRHYYCKLLFCACTFCTRKKLKETETEETIDFLSHFYHWWHFNWEMVELLTPHGYTYAIRHTSVQKVQKKSQPKLNSCLFIKIGNGLNVFQSY